MGNDETSILADKLKTFLWRKTDKTEKQLKYIAKNVSFICVFIGIIEPKRPWAEIREEKKHRHKHTFPPLSLSLQSMYYKCPHKP